MRNSTSWEWPGRNVRYKHAVPGYMGLYVERRRVPSVVSYRALACVVLASALLVILVVTHFA